MRNYLQTEDEDDAFDERGILKDGRRWRVPMYLADSVQREIANYAQRRSPITDGSGGSLGLHRPGFRMVSGTARDTIRDARVALYQSYDDAISQEYKNVCVPDRLSRGKQSANDVATAYAERDAYLRDAWRGGAE